MTLLLAFRNLFHDRVRLAVTLIGILFAIVLIAVQLGLYLGARQMIVAPIDHAEGDVWIMAYGNKNFEEAQPINQRARFTALATPGVAAAVPLITSFSDWKKPGGGNTTSVLIGSDAADGGLAPWNIVEGDLTGLGVRDAVFIDKSYLEEFGVTGVGATAQVNGGRVRVAGLTDGIRSFTTTPFVFTTLARARALMQMGPDQISYVLVKLVPGASAEGVRAALQARLPDEQVLTKAEFRQRSLDHWLLATGAGVALIGGAILGLIVGTVIVAQTLYSSTKDHLNEFATLRALGSSKAYIYKVILSQAALSAALGYALGMIIAISIVVLTERLSLPLPIVMTPGLAVLLFGLTLFMCAISAVAAISKVTRIDPAMVFSR
jgi:putative ABC transport system permease protein